MANLFSALTTATRSLEAQRFALDVTGHNIANVNTPGYARRVVDFHAVAGSHGRDAGGGVEVAGVRAQRDRLTDRRLGEETTAAERETATAELLGLAEAALGTPGQGVDLRLNQFFDSLARLADAPTSAVARQEVVLNGQAVASGFRETARRLETIQRDADQRVRGTIDRVNQLGDRIAALNEQLDGMSDGAPAQALADDQAQLIRELSQLTDITVVRREGLGVDVDVAGGRPLVVGQHSYQMEAVASGADGRIRVHMAGNDITSEVTGGRIGGLIRARDVHVPEYLRQLDVQAYEFANAVNTQHSAGVDLNGDAGQNFFGFNVALTGSTGAAEALIVDADVASDPSLVAAAQAALAGDNRNARALADLRTTRMFDSGTATVADKWGQLVFTVGRDVQTATGEAQIRGQVVDQLEALRDQTSGVSLDEEAMNLVKFQRAYEANARFFQIVDETLTVLMNTVGR